MRFSVRVDADLDCNGSGSARELCCYAAEAHRPDGQDAPQDKLTEVAGNVERGLLLFYCSSLELLLKSFPLPEMHNPYEGVSPPSPRWSQGTGLC